LPLLVLFWTICHSKTRQARIKTQKRIDLTVEFTKKPRFSHAPEAVSLLDAPATPGPSSRYPSNPMRSWELDVRGRSSVQLPAAPVGDTQKSDTQPLTLR
jgi:hypothetical protein